ncbi:hypothetical protein FRB98_008746 [Tulasnella sp. 332]|nr:hypothetical protein FRB98_008746 [Tulasnella sp. 332]
MISRFDTNLDVLLIFAGLSPAVNTPLIVVALTALSANPADETNHPLRLLAMNISNYTPTEGDLALLFTPARGAFFAGLCCSLLAATGAVLAEQWLQNYGRTGRTGPVEALAIRRTEKLVGAENWGLRQVVEGIATLLLISLTLCFITLVDYLWTVNKPVALPVLVFAAARAFLHVAMIVVAAINATCPSQTGPSAALRWPCLAVQRFIYSVEGNKRSQVGRTQARFLILMADSAPHLDNLPMIAENIPLVSDFEGVQLMVSGIAMQTFLSQLRKSLIISGGDTPPTYAVT